MTFIKDIPVDPTWSYESIWQTVGQTQNSLTELVTLLSSPEAENGNRTTDLKILEAIAKIKDDCTGIQKALASRPEFSKLRGDENLYYLVNVRDYLADIVQISKETRGILSRMSVKLSDIEISIDTINSK